jgi:hypothetical protein
MSIFQTVSTVKSGFIIRKVNYCPKAEGYVSNALMNTAIEPVKSARTTSFLKAKTRISATSV